MKPLDRLLHTPGVRPLPLEGAAAFAADPESGPRVLFLPGDRARPEVVDLAVVLGELFEAFPEIEVGIALDASEATMRERFAVTSFPALVFASRGEVRKRLARMQSWATYEQAVRGLVLGEGDPS